MGRLKIAQPGPQEREHSWPQSWVRINQTPKTGLAKHPAACVTLGDQDKGPGFTQNLPLSTLGITAGKMCCCRAREHEIYTKGKEKPAQDKRSYSSVTQMSSYPQVNNLKVI